MLWFPLVTSTIFYEFFLGLLEHILSIQGAGEPLRDQEIWYEKLHNWEKAKAAYQERLDENPHDVEFTLGQMRCMEALGEWYFI